MNGEKECREVIKPFIIQAVPEGMIVFHRKNIWISAEQYQNLIYSICLKTVGNPFWMQQKIWP